MDIEQFQTELDTDKTLRRSFVKDPVAVLRKKGIKLPREAEQELAAAMQGGAQAKSGTTVSTGMKIRF